MTRKLTMEEVTQYLIDEISGEWANGEFVYYLWVNGLGQITKMENSSESFSAVLDERAYVEYPDDEDWRLDVETLDNKYFREVVETIYEEYSDWYDNDREMNADEWKIILKGLYGDDLLNAWNLFCESCKWYDDQIFRMEEFNDIFSGLSPLEVADKLYYNFNSNYDYFRFNAYGYAISSNSLYDWIDFDEMAEAFSDGSVDRGEIEKVLGL